MKFHDDRIRECQLCGRHCECARHHLIGGPLRSKSDRLGLYQDLCPQCHETVHRDAQLMKELRGLAQQTMLKQGWTMEKWMQEFGKNYLDKEV